MNIFLDIEGTLIKSLDEPVAINHQRIKNLLEHLGSSSVSLFAFGFWTQTELEQCTWLVPFLQETHNITINDMAPDQKHSLRGVSRDFHLRRKIKFRNHARKSNHSRKLSRVIVPAPTAFGLDLPPSPEPVQVLCGILHDLG